MRLSHTRRIAWFAICTACALVIQLAGSAQQAVPFENGTPIAPAGFEPQPIPAAPIEYNTAEVMRIRVVPVARGLVNPWSLAFLPAPRLRPGPAYDAGHGEGRALAHHSQRCARSEAGLRRTSRSRARPFRPDGRGAASTVRHESIRLLLVPEACRHRETVGVDRRPRTLRRIRDHRAPGHLQLRARGEWPVAARVGARRQALHDDAERRKRQQLAGSEYLCRQSASPE